MFERIVAYGDSWTWGDCNDLLQKDQSLGERCQINHENNEHGHYFVNSWPTVLAKNLKKNIKNYALPGLSNKAILSNLYDSIVFNCIDPSKDLIIVLLSTWHRDADWVDSNRRYSNYYFSRSPANLKSKCNIPDSDLNLEVVTNEKIKLAYQTFCDFYSITNMLENLKFKYYIGYAFSTIEELSLYIDQSYITEMKKNFNLIDPFIRYAPSVFFKDILLHPSEEEHKIYADYLTDKVFRDIINVQ